MGSASSYRTTTTDIRILDNGRRYVGIYMARLWLWFSFSERINHCDPYTTALLSKSIATVLAKEIITLSLNSLITEVFARTCV